MYTALLIDGGHLRNAFKRVKKDYTAENIGEFACNCFAEGEIIYRIFYYDAPRYEGEQRRPVSKETIEFKSNDTLLNEVAHLENFALRKGRLRFRGWQLRDSAINASAKKPIQLEDRHFAPRFEQKGVDMDLGLDVAAIAETGRVDQFILVSADTDMAPALKFGRIHGMRAILVQLDYENSFVLHDELKRHADAVRTVKV